jgi:hypothetical protein
MRTLLVTLACLIGAAGGSILLYQDFHSAGGGGGQLMAQVDRKESKVRRKAASTFIWSSVSKAEKLFRHDSIQTGEHSHASIKYLDGTQVELGENSLVVIDDLNNLSLNFGSLLVQGQNGSDRQITVGADGKTLVKDLSARLIEPIPLAQFFLGHEPSHNVKFSWKFLKPLSPNSEVTIELGTSEKFENAERVKIGQANHYARDLKPARYFWRLADGSGPLTPASSFVVSEVLPLQPAWPNSAGKVLNFGDAGTQYRWGTHDLDLDKLSKGEHEIQVSQDASFKKILYNEAIEPAVGQIELKALADGFYFWRIASHYGDVSLVSRSEKFAVEKGKRVAVELLSPERDSALSVGAEVRFNWKSSAEHVDYAWEFEQSAGVVTEKKISANALNWKAVAPNNGTIEGVHRWRVRATTAQGQTLGESEWRSVSFFEGKPLVLESPKPGELIHYWEKPGKLDFRWKGDRVENETYQLELASDPDFHQLKLQKTLSSESISAKDLGLTDGAYFWRVKQLSAQGSLKKGSSVQSFTYGVYPELAAPQVQEPQDQMVYTLLEKDLDANFKWAADPEARKYEISLVPVVQGRTPASQAAPALQEVVEKNSYETQKLPVGEYLWSVTPIDRLGRKGQPSAPRKLTVTYGETLAAPEPLTPEVQ